MFSLLLKLCVFILAVYAGWLAFTYPNMLYLVINQTSIEMPLWFALGILFFSFLIFYLFLKMWHGGHDFWVNWQFKRKIKQIQKNQLRTEQAILTWIKGDFSRSQKIINKIPFKTLIHYLIAANCALHQRQKQKLTFYLEKIKQIAPQEQIASEIASLFPITDSTNLEVSNRLIDLQKKLPKHPWLLFACQQFYLSNPNPEKLFPILNELYKQDWLSNEIMQEQLRNNYAAQFKHFSPDQAAFLWKKLPKNIKYHVSLVLIYLEKLSQSEVNQSDAALSLIRYTLKIQWHPDLLKWYSFFNQSPEAKQLSELNQWLKWHGEKPEILFLLGQYCRQQKLWGRAKEYFARCLKFPNQWQALVETLQLFDQLEESEQATHLCKQYILNSSNPKYTSN